MNTFKNFFIATIILFTILSFSRFVIAQGKVEVKSTEIQMQRVGGIRAGFIFALISDGDGGAWVGTEDGGVFHYGVDGKIVQFTTKNGLGDNNGYALAIDKYIIPFEKDTLKPIGLKKRITRMEYDQLNRLVKIIQPNPQFPGDGPITRREYDLLSNVVKTIDPLGNATNYRYDNLNRKISETNAEGGITTFTYHEDGQMRSLTDPVGNTTSWTYNLLGRVSREIVTLDKKMRTRYFYYDVAGNITIKVDRNNRVTSWTYDKLNRPTSEVWHDTWRSFHENKQPIKKITTTYNHSGKIASTEDGDNKFTFAYGIFGNEIKQNQNLTDLKKPIEFNFATDINGLKTEMILKVADKIDHVNKYEVDALNRISKISQVIGDNEIKSVDIQYDDLGQLVKQTRFDSGKEIIVTKNKYDLAGHLTNISHTGNNKTIYADYDLKWDNANRITDFDFTYLNGPEKRSESKYRYDKTSQLINASYNFMQYEKYDFDLNGNRKQAEIQGQKQSYKTSEYNRLLSDENYSYEYDLEGNRISKTDKEGKTTRYTWDNRNRLVKVVTPTSEIEYLYDYKNRLVKRTENKTEQQYFVHDNWQIILQFDNKEPTHRYLWGTKQDELICDNENWTLGDHLNTIRDIVKSDGNVESHHEYNSFGKLISVTKNTDSAYFAYTGKLIDRMSDLQWNVNRWYDSNVGRWVSEDPIGIYVGDINLFRYVRNICLSDTDINGLLSDTDARRILDSWSLNARSDDTIEFPPGYVRFRYQQRQTITSFNELMSNLALTTIPLPVSIRGQAAIEAVKSILKRTVLDVSSGDGQITDEQIIQIIKDVTSEVVYAQHELIPVIRQLIENSGDFTPDDCSFQFIKWKNELTTTATENFECSMWVCGKVKNNMFIPNTIIDWSVSGQCSYDCCAGETSLIKCKAFDTGNNLRVKKNNIKIKANKQP